MNDRSEVTRAFHRPVSNRASRPAFLGVRLAFGLTLVLALGCRRWSCPAAMIIEVPSVSVAPGTSGSFNVLLIDTDPINSASHRVAADAVELSLNGPLGVTFTAASIATSGSAPYLFATSGTTIGANLVDPSRYPFANRDFVASDSEFAAAGYRSVGPGDSYGLVHVTYTVAPGAAPPATDSIMIGASTSLSDDQFNLIGFQGINGSFAVVPLSVVPEPSSLILAAIAAGSGFLMLALRSYGRSGLGSRLAT